MEETILVPKRPREELETQQGEENVVGCEEYSSNSNANTKRHKPYNHIDILSLLESEELEESTQDLSPLITTLQQEITNSNSAPNSSDSGNTLLMSPATHQNDQNNLTTSSGNANLDHDCSNSNSAFSSPHSESDGMLKELDDEEISDENERVMRHLLEASDDELGIPNYTGDFGELDGGFNSSNGDDGFSALCDKLWELEDQTANYYALLQSELFL